MTVMPMGSFLERKKNLKRFLIYGTGKYALEEERFNDSKLINKTGKLTFSPHIQKGNSKNTLKIEFHGKNAILLVNGHQLETIPHQFGLGRGYLVRVGFFISSDKKQKTEIHFDNLFYGQIDDDIVSAKEPVSTKEPVTAKRTRSTGRSRKLICYWSNISRTCT